MTFAESLALNFEQFGLPLEARIFLLKVWECIQFLDDVKDGDPVENPAGAIYTLIVGLPCDEFLATHRAVLGGALATAYHKWQVANVIEDARDETQLDKTYMWRAGYYDLVLLVAALTLPRETVETIGPQVLALYGETMTDYRKEMTHA